MIRLAATVAALACAASAPRPASAAQVPEAAAYLLVDLPSGRTIASGRPDRLDRRVTPGSVIKIATLMAALESGAVDADTKILCRRRWSKEHLTFTCSHPDVGRPLGPAEALAHSCNFYFATIAERLARAAFGDALIALGLPPVGPDVPMPAAGLGLAGLQATPRALLDMLRRVVDPGRLRLRDRTRQVLLDGLAGGARYGTASAVAGQGLTALAKTGTAPMPGGGYLGICVLAAPADRPSRALIVLAPGAAGLAAASLAAGILASHAAADPGPAAAPVRVGRLTPAGTYEVHALPLEEYVAGVVAGEAPIGAPAAALEALAITARTFAAASRGRHDAEGFDLCDLTHCQVLRSPTAASIRAAGATRGQVLVHDDRPAEVYYTAACGGRTENAPAVWPASRAPYLKAREDPACSDSPPWVSSVTAADLVRALRRSGRRGDAVRDVRVVARTASGRVARLAIDGMIPAAISGEELRLAIGRTLGWQVLKSAAFDLERTGQGYRFTGRGVGHGVGLCLVGSARRAGHGASREDLLEAYFPGVAVGALDDLAAFPATPRDVRLDLPATDEVHRSELESLARDLLASLSKATGRRPVGPIRIRVHPSVSSYREATGRPWWTAGAARAGEIDLIPLPALRERDILASTVRHELAHVLIDPVVQDRPLWVREGAALFFAGERPATRGEAACPSDAEIRGAASPDGLRDAYARAAACFAREVAAGRDWREVGRE